MKVLVLLLMFVCNVFGFGIPYAQYNAPATYVERRKECALGPSQWCQNLTTAADCHAVQHCIQTVWLYKSPPPDTTSVCQTCLDMVKEARAQLESNETMEMIKEVFDTSCGYLRVKEIVEMCSKIADNYIPDLIDTLASEMNPQVVCSVAGLCNNEYVHRLLADSGIEAERPRQHDSCYGCHMVISVLEKKFDRTSKDELLQSFLRLCQQLGSFSDSCSNILIRYYGDIYTHITDNLNPTDVCLMAGECSAQFHTHAKNVDVTPMSHVGFINIMDDLPCDLCEQLVVHLRDVLVANTTEEEFKMVLEGLCKQTKGFQDECLSIVDQFYGTIYSYLLTGLNGTVLCGMIDICPSPGNPDVKNIPIAPLLSPENAEKAKLLLGNKPNETEQKEIVVMPEEMQLPIERVMPATVQEMYDEQLCAFCEYFLHYVQEAITNPTTENEIKSVVAKACEKLPASVNNTCLQFVNTYGDAFVAILAQEIDPSIICPLIHVCPSKDKNKDVEVFMQKAITTGNCPLCLFAVTKLEEMVKDKKTEANIKYALNNLCSHLSSNLATECVDFVNTYTDELVEMLIADLSPQEVCVYLKLCNDSVPAPKMPEFSDLPTVRLEKGEIQVETNEIMDNTIGGVIPNEETHLEAESVEEYTSALPKNSPQCVICEFIMKEIEDRLENKNDEAEIKKVVHDVCNYMPRTVKTECNNFVDKYADAIIQLLIATMEPSEICSVMSMCNGKGIQLANEVVECAVCQGVVEAMAKMLDNPNVDHDIEHVTEKACRAFPKKDRKKCIDLIEAYGDELFHLITSNFSRKSVCEKLNLCRPNGIQRPHVLLGQDRCTWGPGYWCKNTDNAKECGTMEHCQKNVWFAEAPAL